MWQLLLVLMLVDWVGAAGSVLLSVVCFGLPFNLYHTHTRRLLSRSVPDYLRAYADTYSRTFAWNLSLSLEYCSAASMLSGSSKFSKSCKFTKLALFSKTGNALALMYREQRVQPPDDVLEATRRCPAQPVDRVQSEQREANVALDVDVRVPQLRQAFHLRGLQM